MAVFPPLAMDNRRLKHAHPRPLDILNHLLDIIATTASPNSSTTPSQPEQPCPFPVPLINHGNNAGNTPLHWAALNTHLNCVKALVEAGADISAKNNAGHDAAFLAERTGWKPQSEEVDLAASDGDAGQNKIPPGLVVAEWLLARDIRTGLEGGEWETETGSAAGGEGKGAGEVTGDEMEGVGKNGLE